MGTLENWKSKVLGIASAPLSRRFAQTSARFTGFGDKIVSMYARGMTTRSIEGHLKEIYGAEVTSGLVPVA